MNRLLAWMINDADDLDQIIDALTSRLQVIVVTAEEGRQLPDCGTPQQRYAAIDVRLEDCVSPSPGPRTS